MTTEQLTLIRPDDWHLHFRDGAALATTVPPHALRFGRVVVMPNLAPPITTVAQALAYRERILAAAPAGLPHFRPLMTLYLTDTTTEAEIAAAAAHPEIIGVKLYPAGATTHSDAGVTDIHRLTPLLRLMAELQLPLLIHAEVTDPHTDIFDREAIFLESILKPMLHEITDLTIVVEHVTTAEMAHFVASAGERVAATLTPQHLHYSRNAIFKGGIRPHLYCLPVLKRERHRRALIEWVAQGHPRFFLGSDSAPHARERKESGCGCAGIFSAPCALESYAQIFTDLGILPRLEAFASRFGAEFYRLPLNTDTLTLERRAWRLPEQLPFGTGSIIPLHAGEELAWQLHLSPL